MYIGGGAWEKSAVIRQARRAVQTINRAVFCSLVWDLERPLQAVFRSFGPPGFALRQARLVFCPRAEISKRAQASRPREDRKPGLMLVEMNELSRDIRPCQQL